MFGEANAVMTAEGLRGLWRGVLPSLYRTVPGVGSTSLPCTGCAILSSKENQMQANPFSLVLLP